MYKKAIYNPKKIKIKELPKIYGFNNGGRPGFYYGELIAEDGTGLGGHICSSEEFMLNDLGIIDGSRPDRHKTFKKHYPSGYIMEFVSDPHTHKKLLTAIKKNQICFKSSENFNDN